MRDQVEVLIRNLPPQAHLVICTRADPGLRLGRLRASGRLAEIRADDLNFTLDEAATLLSRVDVVLSGDSLVRLVDRTEGWPAGLYLATLSLAGRTDPDEFVRQFSGGNRFVVDYLTEEVLARHSDEIREFIVSMSVLDRFSAPLCDFVRGSTGSAAILDHLERSNLFLVPLDDERHWFRFHHLFAAVARIELEFEGPERAQALHSRALEWFRDHGHIDEAVKHALAAGRTTDAAALVAGELAVLRRHRSSRDGRGVARGARKPVRRRRPRGRGDGRVDGGAVRSGGEAEQAPHRARGVP